MLLKRQCTTGARETLELSSMIKQYDKSVLLLKGNSNDSNKYFFG